MRHLKRNITVEITSNEYKVLLAINKSFKDNSVVGVGSVVDRHPIDDMTDKQVSKCLSYLDAKRIININRYDTYSLSRGAYKALGYTGTGASIGVDELEFKDFVPDYNVFIDHIDSFKNQWTYEKTPNGKKSTLVLPGHIRLKSVGSYTVIEAAGKDTETHYTSTNDGKTYREYRDVRLDSELTIGTLIGLITTRNDVISETPEENTDSSMVVEGFKKETPTEKFYNDLMETPVKELKFKRRSGYLGGLDYVCKLDGIGYLTVIEKEKGVRSWFMDDEGTAWAACDGLDIRQRGDLTVQYAIELIKRTSKFRTQR